MGKETYLDRCENNKEKTYRVIQNIYDLCKYKEISVTDLSTQIGKNKTYLSYCLKHKEINFSLLLEICDKLGVSLSRLMTFSYANLVTNKQLHENEEKLKAMESEVYKLRTLVNEQKKALNIANMR